MSTLLVVLLVITCIVVNVAILLQPAKGGTGGTFGGSSQSLFGSAGATSFLFKTTMWGGAFIMVACLALSMIRIREDKRSVIDMGAPVPAAPVAPGGVPAAPQDAQTPLAAPAAPADQAPSK